MLLALLNNASLLAKGRQLDVNGKELMGYAKPYFISPAFAFVAYPNRNSVPFRDFYNIPEAQTVVRGTLRIRTSTGPSPDCSRNFSTPIGMFSRLIIRTAPASRART